LALNKRQIKKEVVLGIQLKYPNIIKIYEVVDVPRLGPVIVLELAHWSLRVVLVDTSLEDVLEMAFRRRFWHARAPPREIIHRDLQAANALLIEDMTSAKIIDFGVATAIDTFRSSLSVSGGAAGTMAFKATESFAGGNSEATNV
jgi:serine/threonine protein kinase